MECNCLEKTFLLSRWKNKWSLHGAAVVADNFYFSGIVTSNRPSVAKLLPRRKITEPCKHQQMLVRKNVDDYFSHIYTTPPDMHANPSDTAERETSPDPLHWPRTCVSLSTLIPSEAEHRQSSWCRNQLACTCQRSFDRKELTSWGRTHLARKTR